MVDDTCWDGVGYPETLLAFVFDVDRGCSAHDLEANAPWVTKVLL